MGREYEEIDLNDFETGDIIDHLEYQYLTRAEVIQMLAIVLTNKKKIEGINLTELQRIIPVEIEPQWPAVKTLADKYKRQAVVENWERLSQTDFEARLSA